MGNKYSRDELREKARVALAARDAGDPRWQALVILCGHMAGIPASEAARQIEAFAK